MLTTIDLKIKRLNPIAPLPKYTREGDNAMDLAGFEPEVNIERGTIKYRTHIAVEIPNGYVGLLFPRSSVTKTNLVLKNSVGVIDSNYRGEIFVIFQIETFDFSSAKVFKDGSMLAQLMILPTPEVNVIEADELEDTNRGDQGFGSSKQYELVELSQYIE